MAFKSKRAQSSGNVRRIAVMIKLDYALAHHIRAFYGIQRYAEQHGNWQMVIDPYAYQRLGGRNPEYSGVIARANAELLETAARSRVPVVNIWKNSPVASRLPAVFPDLAAGGAAAADHLMARGLVRFGALGSSRDKSSVESIRGFRERLQRNGYGCVECSLPRQAFSSPAAWQAARDSIMQWVQGLKRPVGVLAFSDQLANLFADLCTSVHGIDIPYELALIGMGDDRAYCENPGLSISSIDMNYRKVGWRAAELLDEILDGTQPPQDPILVEPGQLVPRNSTDVIAVDDPEISTALRFIAEHCETPIQVPDVAEAVLTSRRTLERRFQKKLGRSIHDQIEYLRLERLKRMLINSDDPVASLARQCGFTDYNHLYRTFARAEGISPKEYRRRRRAGD